MFDTIKALFFSIYGIFIIFTFIYGTFWCLFAYQSTGLLFPLILMITLIAHKAYDENKRTKAKNKNNTYNPKAIDEYIEILNRKKKQ